MFSFVMAAAVIGLELRNSLRRFGTKISDRDLDNIIHTTRTRCNGRCHDKCVVIHYPKGTWYKDLKPEDAPLFVDSLLANEDYTEKVSHSFHGQGFERSSGVSTGVSKEKEKVKKVSKIL